MHLYNELWSIWCTDRSSTKPERLHQFNPTHFHSFPSPQHQSCSGGGFAAHPHSRVPQQLSVTILKSCLFMNICLLGHEFTAMVFPFPSMHYVCLSSWPSSSVAPTPCNDPACTLFLVNYGLCIPHEYFQVLCTTFMCLLLFKKVWSCLSCFPPHTYASEPFFFFHGNCLFHLFIYFSAFAFLVSSSFRALHRSFLHGA